jgi:hypothetical protein
MITAGVNGERTTERLMRATNVDTGTCASRDSLRSAADPSGVGFQPVLSSVPSPPTSATMTIWPAVSARMRPVESTIAPRGAGTSTVRNDCDVACEVYCLPCSTWIDQARSTSTQIAPPMRIARPPTRT